MKSIKSALKKGLTLSLLTMIFLVQPGSSYALTDNDIDVQAVKKVIEESYIQGIHKKQNKDMAELGFHPDFRMLVLRDNELIKVDLEQWFRMMGGSRDSQKDKPGPAVSHTFQFVDVTENVAVAKLEVYKDEKLFATDYMSLYKFNGQWKIVSKVFSFSN